MQRPAERVAGRRKVRRLRLPGDVGIAARVDRDSPPELHVAAADERRVDQRRAGGVQLRDEGLREVLGGTGAIEGSRCGGKVGRLRRAGDVGITRRVHHDAGAILITRAAEERRELDPWIDDELATPIVRVANLEAQARARSCSVQSVPGFDREARTIHHLVRRGCRIPKRSLRRVDQQRAGTIDRETGCAVVGEANVGRTCAGSQIELVLEDARLLANAHVDAVPRLPVDHLLVLGNPRSPG